MNHKLVESYVKDCLKKHYRGNHVFCENGIIYINADVEVYFFEDNIALFGYRTLTTINLNYPPKVSYVDGVEYIVSVIIAFANLEESYKLYKEVI